MVGSIRININIMIPYLQLWNHKDFMLPNGIIKYLSSRDICVDSIMRSIKITVPYFQV